MTDYTLIQGDCLEVMPKLEKESVAMCFADLPYATKGRQVTANAWDVAIDLSKFWPGINFVLPITGWTICSADMPHAARLYASNMSAYRHDVVWHKNGSPTGFLHARHAPLRSHEHLLAFAHKQGTYNPQMVGGGAYRRRGSPRGPNYLGEDYNAERVYAGQRFPRSVLNIHRVEGKRLHPTQKPTALLEWLVSTYTNLGDLVMDPCMGSGVTGEACANLGRRFIGIEKDPAYFAAAKTRIEKAYANAAAGPTQSRLAI